MADEENTTTQEVTLETIAANQELILTALNTIVTKLESVKTAILHRHW